MVVRGVRKSWDTARSRFARIFSFSASALIPCWILIFVVNVQVITATICITMAEIRFSSVRKSKAKNGKVKAKLSISTAKKDAATP